MGRQLLLEALQVELEPWGEHAGSLGALAWGE